MGITIYEYKRETRVELSVRAKVGTKSRYWSVEKYGEKAARRMAEKFIKEEKVRLKKLGTPLRSKDINTMGFQGLSLIWANCRGEKVLTARIRFQDMSGKPLTRSMSLNTHSLVEVAVEYASILSENLTSTGVFGVTLPPLHKIVKALSDEMNRKVGNVK